MGSNWLAEVGADPRARAREIGHVHSAFLIDRQLPCAVPGLREVVARSWERSVEAAVGQDAEPPVTLSGGALAEYRAAHPLARVIEVLRQVVGTAAADGEHLMAVADAEGRLLWVEGDRDARARAARINFVEGAQWDESHAGTNAPGTALALDHEVQIFATEHFRHQVQPWTCAAAPIHDPATGGILGVVDVTGGDIVANPHSLALVRAAARTAEGELWLPQPRGPAVLRALGRHEGLLRIQTSDQGVLQERELRLSRRHTEILVMLILHQDGLTGEQLSEQLYESPACPTTLRAELSRLRRILGDLIASRPYRLTRPVRADFLDVADALRRGDLRAAVDAYPGPLLPSSEGPGVSAQRRWLDTRLRAAALGCADPAPVRAWAERGGFGDLQVWERLALIAPRQSPDRAVAAARVRQLRADYGLPDQPGFADATYLQRHPN
ncbi:GAF domain-containing protein [Streptacidiphilus sp. P02-A3a]|uniref:helix-turn-helix domain-containing protein n=1 Tax=Streptacidiphilus sp. P02-A3a TaxID=2704468 RepID=UPI0015FC4964|nr:GAF domain-containing protein [Streptacidiphilus sp. P02-A3a]QMU68884.1 transcriptional regulator [Streptacidiphilus sp. P02-A3a]